MRLLIVEDEDDIRKAVSNFGEGATFTITLSVA